jgi:enolase
MSEMVADDIFVTGEKLPARDMAGGMADSTLIQLNRNGTVTEMIEAVQMSVKPRYTAVISNGSRETEDVFRAGPTVILLEQKFRLPFALRHRRANGSPCSVRTEPSKNERCI